MNNIENRLCKNIKKTKTNSSKLFVFIVCRQNSHQTIALQVLAKLKRTNTHRNFSLYFISQVVPRFI